GGNQLAPAVAVHVGPADAVDGRLHVDRVQRPRLVERLAALEPLQRTAGLRVRGVPVGAQGEVELAVAVDVVRGDADVVGLGTALQDRVQLPGRVLVPDDTLRIDDDDVALAVAVHVGQGDGVTHVEVLGELLGVEAADLRRGRGRLGRRAGTK